MRMGIINVVWFQLTFPKPTEKAMHEKMNSNLLAHFSRAGMDELSFLSKLPALSLRSAACSSGDMKSVVSMVNGRSL